MPYARLITRVQRSVDPGHDLDRIDVATTALVDEVTAPLPPGPPGRVELIEQSAGHLVVESEVPMERLLLIAESWHPGWQATQDGTPVRLLRVNGDFLGCRVPSGHHRTDLNFQPLSLRRGAILSLAGLALTAAVASSARWSRSRSSRILVQE